MSEIRRIFVRVRFKGQAEDIRPVKVRVTGALKVTATNVTQIVFAEGRMNANGSSDFNDGAGAGQQQALSTWSAVPGQDVSLPGHPGIVFNLLAKPGLSEVTISSATLQDLAIEIKEFSREATVVVTMNQELTLQVQGTPSIFDTNVSATLDDEDMRRSLPYDVRILCAGGGYVDAHRFVLVYQSQFFRCRFRLGGGASVSVGNAKDHNNNDEMDESSSMEVVDLSCCEYATQSLMQTVVGVMYRGCPPAGCFRLSDMLPMMYLADFLHLTQIVSFCQGVVGELMKKASPDFVVTVCGVADQLRLFDLQNEAEARLMQFSEIPEEAFQKISPNCMINFLDHPEKFSLPALSPLSGLSMIDREQFIFKVAMRYLRYDRQRASTCAVAILSKLRLALVQVDDFATLGFPELDSNPETAALLLLAHECRRYSGNLYESKLPRTLWAPRPRSVKHSYWTYSRKGTLRYRCTKNASEEDVALIRSYMPRKVVMERGGDVRIRAIEVSLSHLEGEEVVDGLAFHWDDGTVDSAGGMEGMMLAGSKRFKVQLSRFEGVQPHVVDGNFIKDIKFVPLEVADSAGSSAQDGSGSGGRFNGPFRSGGERGRFDSATGSCKDLSSRCFLDGVKGIVVKVAEGGIQRLAFTALHFKMSLLADGPLDHFLKSAGQEVTGPDINTGSVNCERILTRTALRKALQGNK